MTVTSSSLFGLDFARSPSATAYVAALPAVLMMLDVMGLPTGASLLARFGR